MKKRYLFAMVLAFVLIVGCSKNEETAKDSLDKDLDGETKEPKQTETEEQEFANVYPFTGIGTNENVDNRMVGVMVNNHRKARPQTGLSKADMVFEILAEGKITRFLALFQSEQPDVVGPVRSAREYYFELANSYDALYIYHGAANFVNDMIVNRGIEHLNGSAYDNDGILFKRGTARKAPHNSYLQFDAVYDVAGEKGYETTQDYDPLPFLNEEELSDVQGEEANHVEIVYSASLGNIVSFDYDEESEKYTRFSDNEKTVELNTEEPVQVDNVFIVETHHEVIDDAGRRAVDMESGGNAYIIRKGKAEQVQWENQDGRIIPVKDGQPVGFAPGHTWINVVPTSPGMDGSVTISE